MTNARTEKVEQYLDLIKFCGYNYQRLMDNSVRIDHAWNSLSQDEKDFVTSYFRNKSKA